ncbi:MAG: hypothetical protein U9Q07_04160 [Planctomycetota bacterium]|nr:hypothetical protein [Planctomycetota bacterium]
MNDGKDPSITFTAREWAMHQAGVVQGTATGMKAVATQLRQALTLSVDAARKQVEKGDDETDVSESGLAALETWTGSLQPWIDAILKDAEKYMEQSNARVKEIGPAPRNLRNRFVGAILKGASEFKKG